MKTGDYAAACPSSASQRLDAGVGIVYLPRRVLRTRGKIGERVGDLAREVAHRRVARAARPTECMPSRADALRGRAAASPSSMRPRPRHGGEAGRRRGLGGTWGAPVPVDPGDHAFTASSRASARGRARSRSPPRRRSRSSSPRFEDEAAAPTPTPQPAPRPVEPAPSSGWSAQLGQRRGRGRRRRRARRWAPSSSARRLDVGGDVQGSLPEQQVRRRSGPSDVDSARTAGNVSTVLVVGGAAPSRAAPSSVHRRSQGGTRTRACKRRARRRSSSALVTVGGARRT